jgi:hypothetical protein
MSKKIVIIFFATNWSKYEKKNPDKKLKKNWPKIDPKIVKNTSKNRQQFVRN